MSIAHHPSETMLTAFAAGTLDHGQHVALATHLVSCPLCRDFARAMEYVGGAMLADLPPAPLSDRALRDIEARLNEPTPPPAPRTKTAPVVPESELPGLPKFVRSYDFGNWRWVAPSVRVRPIALPHASATRVFLLKSGAGTKMLQHTHTGIELTCVLSGAFRQDESRYGPGDFDSGDPTVDHEPVIERGEDCVCLVAMRGELYLKGLIGRLVQSFVRL